MTRTPAQVTVEKAALGPLTRLATGNQAIVHTIRGVPPISGAEGSYVFKQYRTKILRECALSIATTMPQLVLHPDGLSEEDRKAVRRHTVWPQALVTENGGAVGILMKLIPNPFFFDLKLSGSGTISRELFELHYLMRPESKKAELGIPAASLRDRLFLVVDVLKVMSFLHRTGLVVGDVSPRNIAVSNPDVLGERGPHRFLPKFLDVDSFRFSGGVPAIPQGHTPSWLPPEVRAAENRRAELIARGASLIEISRARADVTTQSTKTDIFKMGLLTLRLFHEPSDPDEDDTQSLYVSESATANIRRLVGAIKAKALLSMLDTDPNSRPTAREVLTTVTGR